MKQMVRYWSERAGRWVEYERVSAAKKPGTAGRKKAAKPSTSSAKQRKKSQPSAGKKAPSSAKLGTSSKRKVKQEKTSTDDDKEGGRWSGAVENGGVKKEKNQTQKARGQRKGSLTESQAYQRAVLSARDARAEKARRACPDAPTAAECRQNDMVLRRGSVTKTGSVRCASCVEDVGQSGKGASGVRIVVRPGKLAPWKKALSSDQRHAALEQAIKRTMREDDVTKHEAAVAVARRLNVLYIYNKNNTTPAAVSMCNTVLDDEEWLRNKYGMEPLDRDSRYCAENYS